ncbi:centrosome-associated protein [Holotrichia oblita]|uniref:Centrosome-associated protein n=1 Tax=Holotrichia oblita TaxID=644536 RepID=A0ACB9TT63_HOLOL|nr:centrosome-associated protein [Holotrichia oblita]
MKIQMQASQNVIDVRKEKLKELQKRSLELVQKNITLKRERSRSREKKTLPEKVIPQNDIKMNMKLTNKKQEINIKNTSDPTNNCKDNITNRVPDLIVNNTEEVPAVCSIKDQNVQTEFDFKNICVRNNTKDELIPFDNLVKQDTDIRNKAALKIQSCYRRYRQQKIFKNILKSKKKKLNNMLKNIKPVLNTESPKPIAEKPAQNNVPFWLQTVVEPYPYNFIIKSCRSETNVPKLLNQEKRNKDPHNDIESDDNLKSFLEYMTSLEDSKKSRSLQKRSSSHRTSNSFKTLPSKSEKNSESVADNIKTDSSVENYSTNFSNSAASITSSVPLLQHPSLTLTTSERAELPLQEQNRNSISIKPGEIKCIETKSNTNQIHLKFEAELHLLNDFNESLRQFMAVEKSLIELHGTNQSNIKIHQNQDTQTTAPLPPTTLKNPDDTIDTTTDNSQISEKTMPTINYERGSDIMEENDKTLDVLKNLQDDIKNSNVEEDIQQELCHYSNKDNNSVLMGLELSQLNEAINSTIDVSMSNTSAPDVSFNSNVYVGFSVGMFDQLIRDEDARIENLKTILKIREKALLDRTKGELAWLEIQKKQLIETGQLHEASLLKKKQRGIIIKLQHEKQEMQRLKQIQKAASKERKTILKEQRNMIKAQLSNSNAVPKIRRTVYKERRHLGPVKVYNLHRETINTETSISRRSSLAEEIIITSRSESIVGQISEECPGDHDTKLEMAANTIIKQVPVHVGDSLCKSEDEKYDFKGSQLNFLWSNMTGRDEKKFKDDERYSLNQITLEKFCIDAKKNLIEKKRHLDKIEKNSTSSNSSVKSIDDLIKDKSESDGHTVLESAIIEDIKSDNDSTETERRKSISNGDKCYQSQDNTYSYSFESDALEGIDENIFVEEKNEVNTIKSNADVLVNEIDRSKSTLSEIMQNISNITDEISAIYKLSSVANTIKDESVHSNVNTDNVDIRTKVTDSYIIRKDSGDISQRDESEDDTLKSSVQSEIVKSLTELISSQNACQDIKFEQKHNIIETPESVQGETNKTVTNDIESAVSLHTDLNKELPREDAVVKDSFISVTEQEEITDSSKTKVEVISVSKGSGDVINDLRTESNNQSVMTKVCSVNDTLNAIKNNAVTSIEESQNNEITENNTSKSEIRNMLDLSYGFTGVRTNKHETISSISEINTSMRGETNITNELPIENGFNNFDHIISDNKINSKENSCLPVDDVLNKSLVIKEDENKCELETNIKNNSTSDKLINKLALNSIHSDSLNIDLNKSNEETTISTESGFEKSVNIEEYNYANEDEEKHNDLENINNTKLSSPVKINESIIGSNTKNSNDVSITNEIKEEKSCVDNLLLDDVNNSSKDIKCSSVSENIDDNLKLITSSQNDNIKSESLNESDIQDEEDISDLSNKSLDDTSEELSSDNDREKLVLNLEKLYDIEDSKSMITKKENANNLVDVKKRVSEILADTTPAREDKSPRLQDIYTTTYDVLSPEHSPETGSPANNGRNIASVTQLYDEEAEALFKKQLAIEQEIKQLEQQQKEHIPYIYMREIPNKPPPPYTPPTSQIHVSTVLPSSVEQLQCMTSIISDRLFKAYINGNLETATPNITEESKLLTRHNIDKECFEFIFDLCKEFAVEHYKQFVEYSGPSWMVVNKRSLAKRKPFDGNDLKAYLFKKTKEILEFEKVIFKEKMITKWSRKKRDHVDEILVIESQTEESEWTNYDDDEVIVKNELTNDIMNMLLTETANVIKSLIKDHIAKESSNWNKQHQNVISSLNDNLKFIPKDYSP